MGVRLAVVAIVLLASCQGQRRDLDPVVKELLWEIQRAQERGAYTQVLSLVDSALVLSPRYPPLYFVRGRMLAKLYRFEEAEVAFEHVLTLDDQYHGAAYQMGNNAFFLGRNRKALQYYMQEQSVLEGSTAQMLHDVFAQMGRVYAQLGVVDSARWAYEQAVALQENDAQVWAWLAELSEDGGNPEQALEEARRALELEHANMEYQYLAGALHLRTGAVEEAEDYLRAVIREMPWHVGGHYNLGRCLLALGREAEATPFLAATDSLQTLHADIILARFAVQRNPRDEEHWRILGLLYQQAGRRREAREVFAILRQLGS